MKFSNMLAPSFQSDYLARCRQVLSRYNLDWQAATIVPLNGPGGFSGARIWRVQVDNRHLALRCWPNPASDYQRLAGLHQLLEHTWRLGVTQIAVPLRTSYGESLLQIDGEMWQLEPWMPGAADFHRQPSRARLAATMRVLGRWHIAAKSFSPNQQHLHWFATQEAVCSPGLRERAETLSQASQIKLPQYREALSGYPASALRQPLEKICLHLSHHGTRILHKLHHNSNLRTPIQPALRDIWHDHLLFTGNELTGLIDASACRSESVVTDLARVLCSLLRDDRAEWDFALQCYQEVRPLSLTELQLLPVFDQSAVLLSGVTWLEWLLIQRRTFANSEQVLRRLKEVVGRMERLEL